MAGHLSPIAPPPEPPGLGIVSLIGANVKVPPASRLMRLPSSDSDLFLPAARTTPSKRRSAWSDGRRLFSRRGQSAQNVLLVDAILVSRIRRFNIDFAPPILP
jgi:hypothetical protein